MPLIDFLLIIVLLGFIWFGFWFGLIHTLGALVGTFLGAWLASRVYLPLYDLVVNWTGYESEWIKIAIFIIIFIIINRLVGFGFYILDRTFRFVSFIPFLKTINRIGGAVLGLVEGAFSLGLILYFTGTINLPLAVEQAILNSDIAQNLISFAGILIPLLPQVWDKFSPYADIVNIQFE